MNKRSLQWILVLPLVACAGLPPEVGESDQAICNGDPADCAPPQPDPPTSGPDLVPEIASGTACPVGAGSWVTVRVRNKGDVATTKKSVLKTKACQYTGAQYFCWAHCFLVGPLAAGASTNSAVDLGDCVNNGTAAMDGRTTPVVTMQFANYVFPDYTDVGPLVFWTATADTSMSRVWYNPGGTGYYQQSYSPSVTETDETNNQIGSGAWCR